MSTTERFAPPTQADRMRISELMFGALASNTVGTAARLGLADLLDDDTERPAAEIAAAAGTPPVATIRLLRALAALGLVTETRPDHFRLTPFGALLRSDHPNSALAGFRTFTDRAFLDSWRELDTAVRTGEPVFEQVHGVAFFDYLAARPELSQRFNATMRQGSLPTARALAEHLDLGGAGTVCDIGGGDGTVLAELLREHPDLRGILHDTEAGLAEAGPVLQAAGVADRCRTETGDFFAGVPAGADVYVIKSVIHDWDDDRCATILGHCRRVIPEHGRLLIVEPVLPPVVDGSIPPLMYLSDLNMLVLLGGRERTAADFEALCARAGFTLRGVQRLPPPVPFAVLEAVPG